MINKQPNDDGLIDEILDITEIQKSRHTRLIALRVIQAVRDHDRILMKEAVMKLSARTHNRRVFLQIIEKILAE
jgi:hypothetical protein